MNRINKRAPVAPSSEPPVATRGPGRPATGVGTPIQVRLQPPDLESLDRWIGGQDGRKPSRPAAIRSLIRLALSALGAR